MDITASFEALQKTANAATESLRALISSIAEAPDFTPVRAYCWTGRTHPEWVKVLNRTKKKRTRKKYYDRIMREYKKEVDNG